MDTKRIICKKLSFYLCLSNFYNPIFYYLNTLAVSSSTILKKSTESKQNLPSFWNYWVFSYDSWWLLDSHTYILSLWRSFPLFLFTRYREWLLSFVTCFFSVYRENHMIVLFNMINIRFPIIDPSLHCWNKFILLITNYCFQGIQIVFFFFKKLPLLFGLLLLDIVKGQEAKP